MARAVQLARRGLYSTRPNPLVGCVLVKDDRIVGEGWHEVAGQAHAEVNALRVAGQNARNATAYVTLEPCSHEGRTGPCCVALVEAGVSRVVMAMVDPNPQVAGSGAAYLRANGVEVLQGLLQTEAEALNPAYLKWARKGRSYVRCKLAMSLDGRTALADGTSKWITGQEARADVQRLRARSGALVTGVGTVLADNPRMNLRDEELLIANKEWVLEHPPARIVLDTNLRTPVNARLFESSGPVIIMHGPKAPVGNHDALVTAGAKVRVVSLGQDGRLDLTEVLNHLGKQEYNELLFETGAVLAGALIQARLVDELIIYVSARFLGDSGLPLLRLPRFVGMDDTINLTFTDIRQVGADLRITVLPEYP